MENFSLPSKSYSWSCVGFFCLWRLLWGCLLHKMLVYLRLKVLKQVTHENYSLFLKVKSVYFFSGRIKRDVVVIAKRKKKKKRKRNWIETWFSKNFKREDLFWFSWFASSEFFDLIYKKNSQVKPDVILFSFFCFIAKTHSWGSGICAVGSRFFLSSGVSSKQSLRFRETVGSIIFLFLGWCFVEKRKKKWRRISKVLFHKKK